MYAEDSDFMTGNKIFECIGDLKLKNTEGYDRIPQRILIDGRISLISPLTSLFALIYRDKIVPGQWLISKTIPVHLNWLNMSRDTYRVHCK